MNFKKKIIYRSAQVVETFCQCIFSTVLTVYLRTYLEEMKIKVMEFRGSGDLCYENIDGTEGSFVGFVQSFFEKTMTSLKSTALVKYPVHAILLNVSA